MKNGADEIDMVINIGWVKDKKFAQIEEEIRTLKKSMWNKNFKSHYRNMPSDRRGKNTTV